MTMSETKVGQKDVKGRQRASKAEDETSKHSRKDFARRNKTKMNRKQDDKGDESETRQMDLV